MKRIIALLALVGLSLTAEAGTAKLDWIPPTTRADGTALTDLAGYRVYYGSMASELTQNVTIADPTARTTTLTVPDGKWYFALVAYSAGGTSSDFSTVVNKTVTATIPPPLTTLGPYAYELVTANGAESMAAIGLTLPGLPCGPGTRLIASVRFCQLQRNQADIVGWPKDKTLAAGIWAKSAPP